MSVQKTMLANGSSRTAADGGGEVHQAADGLPGDEDQHVEEQSQAGEPQISVQTEEILQDPQIHAGLEGLSELDGQHVDGTEYTGDTLQHEGDQSTEQGLYDGQQDESGIPEGQMYSNIEGGGVEDAGQSEDMLQTGPADEQQADGTGEHTAEVHGEQTNGADDAGQDYVESTAEDPNQGNGTYYEQDYSTYDFPSSSAAALAASAAQSSLSAFQPHPQHPHLGVEALGQAAAQTQHLDPLPLAEGDAHEEDGADHVYHGEINGTEEAMDMAHSSGDPSIAIDALPHDADFNGEQQDPSSGRAPRQMHALTDHSKRETPYSRTPDMRNSHKLAERRRRKEMRELFDELRDQLPVDQGPKTSKWEVLSKAIEHVAALQQERDALYSEVQALRASVGQPMSGMEGEGVEEQEVHQNQDAPVEAGDEGAVEYDKYDEQEETNGQQEEGAADAVANGEYNAEEYAQQDGNEAVGLGGEEQYQIEQEEHADQHDESVYQQAEGGADGFEEQQALDPKPQEDWASITA